MTEFWLFLIVGAIAVASAVMMFLSDNAVYSALFLIVVMGCIAFLFLLLEAPFLAMIQITVYAGAIMVLFVFVIMLLGAERIGAQRPTFRWLTPLAVVLSAAFLLLAGIALAARGDVDEQRPAPDAPRLRVLNVASDATSVDVYANDELIAADLDYNEVSDFVALEPGDYTVAFTPENGEPITATFTFAPDSEQTLVAYGIEDAITLSVVPTDTTAPEARSARVTFFNAYPDMEEVMLVDLGSNAEVDLDVSGALSDRVLIEDFAPGAVSQPLMVEEDVVHWAFVTPDGRIVKRVLGEERGLAYDVERDTSQLIVLAADRSMIDRALSASAVVVVDEAEAQFGSPEAIGQDLFTRYLLPFELVSILLLVAMTGAIVLTHKEDARVRDRAALRRRVSRPLASVIAEQVGHDVTADKDAPALPAAGSQTPAGD